MLAKEKKITYTFVTTFQKMTAIDRLTQYMQEAGEAGRREMSAAIGVSHVMIGRMVQRLTEEGVLKETGYAPSGGGRPEKRYRYNGAHACVLLFRMNEEENRGTLELLDMQGRLLEQQSARFTHLHAEILDGWLDALTRRWQRKVRHMALYVPQTHGIHELMTHLKQERGLNVLPLNAAEALADKRPHTLTLLCRQGMPPQAAYRSGAELLPCKHLHMLPLPDRWETMDYSDHTLTEEMICRLLQSLTCVLSPDSVVLYCDYLTERLISRIRYNLSAKLKGMEHTPHLHFRSINAEQIIPVLRQASARV